MMIYISRKVLVTVGIIYFRPDYQNIVQQFVWQTDDVPPELQRVRRFIDYWKHNIEAVIKSVEIAVPDRSGKPTWQAADWLGNC